MENQIYWSVQSVFVTHSLFLILFNIAFRDVETD